MLFCNECEKQHFDKKVCNANFADKHFDAISGEVFIFSPIESNFQANFTQIDLLYHRIF